MQNGKRERRFGYLCLHNDVDIKISIIYKNRKNVQNNLKFS